MLNDSIFFDKKKFNIWEIICQISSSESKKFQKYYFANFDELELRISRSEKD
jgi:hypothetical protein